MGIPQHEHRLFEDVLHTQIVEICPFTSATTHFRSKISESYEGEEHFNPLHKRLCAISIDSLQIQ